MDGRKLRNALLKILCMYFLAILESSRMHEIGRLVLFSATTAGQSIELRSYFRFGFQSTSIPRT